MICKWDKVHGVGMKLLVLFIVTGQSWTEFCPALGFCDFIVLFASMVEDQPNFVQALLCCEFASLKHYPIAVAHVLAIVKSFYIRREIFSLFNSIVSQISSSQPCPCACFAVSKVCWQLMNLKWSFVRPWTTPMMRYLQMEPMNLIRVRPPLTT